MCADSYVFYSMITSTHSPHWHGVCLAFSGAAFALCRASPRWRARHSRVDGQLQGGMIDVLRAACDKLHYRCQFTSVPLARAMKKSGEMRTLLGKYGVRAAP